MTWFRVWTELKLVFVSGSVPNWLVGRVGIEIVCCGRNELGFVWGIEIALVLVSKPKLTCFLCGCQNWPCLCVRVENYVFLVWAWKLTCFWWWSKWTWPQCGGSNLTWFKCRDENDLVIGWVVEINLCAGRKLRVSSIGMIIDFVFVPVVQIDLISGWGIEFHLIPLWGI